MIPPGESDWVVVLASKEDLRIDAVARALAGGRKDAVLDATRTARRARGIVLEKATQAEAEALVERLAAEGVEAKAGYAAALSAVPAAILLARAAPGPEGLQVEFRGGGECLVPWARVRILVLGAWEENVQAGTKEVEDAPSAGRIAMSIGVTIAGAAAGVPFHTGIVPEGEKRRVPVIKAETRWVLDLLLREPEERFRIRTEDFDWSGLGPRMAQTSTLNTRALAEEILRFAPDAGTSPGVDLLYTGGRLASIAHDSPEGLEREERWLLSVLPA